LALLRADPIVALPNHDRLANPHAVFQPVRFRVERFEYLSSDLLLRLSVRLSLEPAGDAPPMLFVEREAVDHAYPPLLSCTARTPLKEPGEWLWRGAFAVPPDLALDPDALFALRLREEVLLTLPAPSEHVFAPDGTTPSQVGPRTWLYTVKRGALLFVVTCQLCVMPGWSAGGALAASAGATTSETPTAETPAGETPAGETPAGETPPSKTPPSETPTTTEASPPPPTATNPTPPEASAGPSAGEAPATTTTSSGPAPASTSTGPAPGTTAPGAKGSAPSAPAALRVTLQRPQRATPAKKAGSNLTATHAKPSTLGTNLKKTSAPANNSIALPPSFAAAQAGMLATELSGPVLSQALAFYRIPPFLLPIYRAAAVQYGVPWQILAAINEIETDYGSDLSVSSAGAVGWMQFMPATWLQYGVDALNAGYADPYNPVDAIFAAARYLRAAGAQSDLRSAILAYNHSDQYLQSVLLRAKLISAYPQRAIGTLTGLIDALEPVSGKQISWGALPPSASSSSATAHATLVGRTPAAAAPATPGPSDAPSPTAAAARLTAAARPAQLIEVLSAPQAAVVAVQDGRITQMGSSRKLGRFIVLRDVYGDLFTYAGLGSIVSRYAPAKAARTPVKAPSALVKEAAPKLPAGGALEPFPTPAVKAPTASRQSPAGVRPLLRSSDALTLTGGKARLFAHPGNPDAVAAAPRVSAGARHSKHSDGRLPLRVGSAVSQGTVLGYVHVPSGAKDGHLRFAIQPAGDSDTIDPRPILSSWKQLAAALHPQDAKGHLIEEILKGALTSVAHSARAARTASSPLAVIGKLSSAQWDRLIARIALLPAPNVAAKPSASAIPDP
jgi:soluble lytic murein transglycosylase-like protein